jgi:hypothetical protein
MMCSKLFLPLLLATMPAVVLLAGEAQERAEPEGTLRYQRVYAPAERISEWPTGHGKYLPMEAAEFERLLSLTRSGAPEKQGALTAWITAAEYQARLDSEDILTGRAILDITHHSQSATMLTLEPCNVAVREANWMPADTNADAQTEKIISGLSSQGKLQVVVRQSGKLSFTWTLAGRHDIGDAMAFFCEFPACPVGVLWLDLPENLTPAVDKGLVSGAESAAEGRRKWRVELGGQNRFHLRLISSGGAHVRQPLALLRESRVYEFSPRGIDLSVQWKVQIHNEPLEKIIVLLDPGVQLATARLGDVALPWTIEAPAGEAGTRAVLLLPEPIQDTERVLRLGALAPLTLDRPFRVPRIQAEGLFWQEGDTTFNVLDPLVIERLTPFECSQKAVGPLPEPYVGETLQFQNYSPDAGLELTLAHPRGKTQLVSATAVELGSRQITARVAADYRTHDTAQFNMEAEISKSWFIDSVESIPTDALADWNLESRTDDRQKLILHLSRTPSQKQALRLIINARRLRTYTRRQWSVEELLPLRFTQPVENKRLVAIQAVGANDLKLSGGEQLIRLSSPNLSAEELELFANPPGDLLFLDDAGAAGAEIAATPQKPAYSCDILVTANVSKDRLQENYVLRCVPEAARVDRVMIQLSQSRDAPPQWTLGSEDDKQLSARRLSKGEQISAGLGTAGETWEITLRRPRSAAFEIHGARETTLQGAEPVCLAALPEAARQRGTLVVRSSSAEGLQIENRRLKSIPPEPVSADQYSPVRATFHYDPVHDVTLAAEPVLMLATSKETLPSIFVWSCHLHSWYQDQGGARHLAGYEVQNNGQSRIKFVLPPGVFVDDLRGVWIDDAPVSWQQITERQSAATEQAKSDAVSLPLPAAKRFATVSIYFVTHESGLGTFGSLSPPLPKAEAPVLGGTWTAWLPPGFEIVGGDSPSLSTQRPTSSWSRRLFGPLGRDAGQEVFHPPSAGQTDNSFIPASSGHKIAVEGKTFRAGSGPGGWQPAGAQGWTAECIELLTAKSVQIKYVNRFGQLWWAMLIFILSMALGCWKAAQRPIFFTMLTGIFAIAAFVLPEAYVPLATAGVLGMLACLLLGIIHRCLKKIVSAQRSGRNILAESPSSSVKAAASASQAGALLLFICAAVLFAVSAQAAESGEESRAVVSRDYRVFIPIDAGRKPAGDKVYVPEQFYQELYRLATKAKQEPQGWLLQSAVYRGSLVREAATGRLAPEAIKAKFKLHIFGRMVHVKLPLRRENVDLVPDSLTLDGRPIEPAWETDGNALSFDVEEPGKYLLEMALQPKSLSVGASTGFEMSIPRLAQSRLELNVPAEMQGAEVPSAIGAVRVETDPPRLIADLGPSNRLTVRWPENSPSGPKKSTLYIDQFIWVKVQSGSVVIDVRCKFHELEGQISRVQLATDPRLRLLPLQGKDAPTVDVHADYAQPQIITLQWNHPPSQEVTLDLSFLLTGASGVGNFRLPQIKLLDAPAGKRWLAVSVDPALQFESQRSPDLETITTAEFLKNWGASASGPLQAYRLVGDEADWSFSTRPREAEISAQQSLSLSFDQNNVEANFKAQLTVAAGYVFQYQLSAPAAMQVLQLSVQKDGVEQSARWSQDKDGAITVFLKGPTDGQQQLSLHGLMPLESKTKLPLPGISLQQCRVQATTLQVFRRPAVQLELTVPESIKTIPKSVSETDLGEQGRGVQTFHVEGPDTLQGEVRLRVNRPDIQARQVTRLHQAQRQWIAKTDFQLAISEGVVDQFWIEIPDSWKEPFTIDPPATVKVVQGSGERRLLVQPRFAVAGPYHFSVAGALEFKPGAAPSAPDIYLRKTKEYARWLVLPRQLNDQPVGWETHGLRPARLPAAMATPGEEKNNFVYECINERFSATLRSQTVLPGSAKVRLADIRLAWQADGLWRGVAMFDLEPGANNFCSLLMPEESELVFVDIDGLVVSPLQLGPGSWQLPLVSERLPQRISVVFKGGFNDPMHGGLKKFSAPSLGDLPVGDTLWTISSPPSLRPEIGKDKKTATLCDQQWIRLRNTAATITSAAELLQLDDAEETLRWYQLQARYLTEARSSLQNQLDLEPDSQSTKALKQKIEAIDKRQNECAQRIGLSNVLVQAKAGFTTTGEPGDYWHHRLEEPGNIARYAFEGSAASISIGYHRSTQMGLGRRIFAVLCLGGAVFLFGWGVRRGTWTALINERPHALGIAVGLAWWCWLWPSFLGLLLVLICLVSWWRTHRQERAETTSTSVSS